MGRKARSQTVTQRQQVDAVLRLETGDGWGLNLRPSDLPKTIGRAPTNDIEIPDGNISRLHCGLEWDEGRFLLVDLGSTHGTWVGDRRLPRGGRMVLSGTVYLVFHGILLRLVATYGVGDPEQIAGQAKSWAGDDAIAHGICLVDLCDSTEMRREALEVATRQLRGALVGSQPEQILLLKNTGDGWLAIYHQPMAALAAAERILAGKASGGLSADVRVTLDAGPTWKSSAGDRIGLAINRAARLEKTQARDLDEPLVDSGLVVPRNRILLSGFMHDQLPPATHGRCRLVGRRRLKGFGDDMFPVWILRV